MRACQSVVAKGPIRPEGRAFRPQEEEPAAPMAASGSAAEPEERDEAEEELASVGRLFVKNLSYSWLCY